MKQILQQLAACNIWANERLINCVMALPGEWFTKELPGSFPSLHATLMHILDAENIWWQRMKMQEIITAPSAGFKGSSYDLMHAVLVQNKLWESWITNASLAALEHVFHYQNTKREQFKQPVYQMLLHVFNHGTYHRGQLVTMLRQLEVQKIPATDFIVFSRLK